jgi:ribosome-associated heat shock protein Hsp15
MEKIRIDKWLWAARFFKTRSLAAQEVERGRVQVNQADVKPSKEVKAGDLINLIQGSVPRTVLVCGVSGQRGSAVVAQALFEETALSKEKRALAAEHNRLHPEPAHTLEHGRPTKRDRRKMEHAWNDRWSASVD